MMVTLDNYEEYMLLEADGELDEAGRAALYAFLEQHPELKKEMDAYMSTRLVPDTNMVFEHKESLLKDEPGKKIFSLGNWWIYAAAAAVVLFVVTFMNREQQEEIPGTAIVKTETKNTTPQNNISNHINTAPVTDSDKSLHSTPADPIAYENKKPHQQKTSIKAPVANPVVKRPVQEESIAHQPLPPAETPRKQPMPEKQPIIPAPEPVQVPQEHVAVETPQPAEQQPELKERRSLLASLPLDEGRREGLNELTDAVNNKIERIKNMTSSIKGTDVKVKIGNRDLFVVKF